MYSCMYMDFVPEINLFVFKIKTHADPWVLERIDRADAFVWVRCQHTVDQVLRFRGDGVPLWRRVLEPYCFRSSKHYM